MLQTLDIWKINPESPQYMWYHPKYYPDASEELHDQTPEDIMRLVSEGWIVQKVE